MIIAGCQPVENPVPEPPQESVKPLTVPVPVIEEPSASITEEDTAAANVPEREIPDVPVVAVPDDWRQLSLRQKIAQMIMVRIRGDFYNDEYWYRSDLEYWIKNDGIGGVITFGGSVHGTYRNIRQFQDWANIPLLVAADYERGTGQWLDGGTLFPPNMAVAATNDPRNAYEQGVITAKEGLALGVHITFSPVMDVNNNPANPIINFRAYGDTPELVTQYGLAFMKGVQENGMLACVKHYPGHGNTSTDSHSNLPTIPGDRASLEKIELAPFKKAVESGVSMVMVGHIAMPGLDDSKRPATHSEKIVTGILRDEWGFDGLIITDGMEMTGLTRSAWAGESAVRAVEAGADILLLPMDVRQTIDAIEYAVNSGRISQSRIDRSVERIWKTKAQLGLFGENPFPQWDDVEKTVGIPSNTKTAKNIARASITVVKDSGNLPLKPEKINRLGHLILSTDDNVTDRLSPFIRDISNTHGNVKKIVVTDALSDNRMKEIISTLKKMDMTVVTLLVRIRMGKGKSTIDDSHDALMKKMKQAGIKFITISFGSPYLPDYESMDTYICAWGYGSVSCKAAADAVWGRITTAGKLPVTLSSAYPRSTGLEISRRWTAFEPADVKIDLSSAWSVIDSAIQQHVFPGAQVFIARKGKVIASRGFGNFTYDKNAKPVTTTTRYDVASLTKVLVTTPVAMKLYQKKLIGLDHTVEQYFPQFTGKGREKVTLRHLFTHSSGLPPYKRYFLDENFTSEEDVINDILRTDLQFQPGTEYKYSDLGIILLGQVLEKAARSPLESMARRWVFKPFGMTHTSYNPAPSLRAEIAPTEYDSLYRKELVQGVVHDENTYLMGGVSSHAGVFSTAEDMGNYAQMLLNGGTYLGRRYFDSSVIRAFSRRQNLPPGSDRALGWDTPSRNGKSSAGDYFSDTSFGHLGFTGTSLWIDPEEEIIVVLLTNRVHPTRTRGGMYSVRRQFHTEVMKALLEK